MTAGLLWAILGLGLADSLNPATIVTITLILLTVRKHPVTSALSFVVGALSTVFILGTVIFLGAGAAADTVSDGLAWLRRIVFLVAAVTLFITGYRRLKDRPRKGIGLPSWFGIGTAFPFGVLVTGADLPNAFPYFIAIERMVDADTSTGTGLLVLAGYAIIYCVPCLILLALGIAHGDKVRKNFKRSTTDSPRAPPNDRLLQRCSIFSWGSASSRSPSGLNGRA
ncbi:GAP family protein [Paenarthrobacter sp. CCNWLY172]|uniref:GAP family protein n=1 Tax=unclassified Paenarthrobacter TaxID=2634190 RepID=UPI00307732D0